MIYSLIIVMHFNILFIYSIFLFFYEGGRLICSLPGSHKLILSQNEPVTQSN